MNTIFENGKTHVTMATTLFDGATITRDEFIEKMHEFFAALTDEYTDYVQNMLIEKADAYYNHKYEYELRQITKSVQHYKRESTKTRKIDEYMKYIVEKYGAECENRKKVYLPTIKFRAFPMSNGISNDACVHPSQIEKFGLCYDAIQNSKYFRACKGIEFHYTHNGETPDICSACEDVTFLMSDEMVDAYKADERALSDAIYAFYADSKYFGD